MWIELTEPNADVATPSVLVVLTRSGDGCDDSDENGMKQAVTYTRTGVADADGNTTVVPFRYDPPATASCGLLVTTLEAQPGGHVVGAFDGDLTQTGTPADDVPRMVHVALTFDVRVTD